MIEKELINLRTVLKVVGFVVLRMPSADFAFPPALPPSMPTFRLWGGGHNAKSQSRSQPTFQTDFPNRLLEPTFGRLTKSAKSVKPTFKTDFSRLQSWQSRSNRLFHSKVGLRAKSVGQIDFRLLPIAKSAKSGDFVLRKVGQTDFCRKVGLANRLCKVGKVGLKVCSPNRLLQSRQSRQSRLVAGTRAPRRPKTKASSHSPRGPRPGAVDPNIPNFVERHLEENNHGIKKTFSTS